MQLAAFIQAHICSIYSYVCITCVHVYVYSYTFGHSYLASNTATDLHINCKSVQKISTFKLITKLAIAIAIAS